MPEVWIPAHHQAAPKRSILTNLANKVVGVKHHKGQAVKDPGVLTENFTLGLSQAMLEEARGTRHGRLLLELLRAVDYAGEQSRPIMLMGRKIAAGGFKLQVVIPIQTALKPGAPPTVTKGHGVERVA